MGRGSSQLWARKFFSGHPASILRNEGRGFILAILVVGLWNSASLGCFDPTSHHVNLPVDKGPPRNVSKMTAVAGRPWQH